MRSKECHRSMLWLPLGGRNDTLISLFASCATHQSYITEEKTTCHTCTTDRGVIIEIWKHKTYLECFGCSLLAAKPRSSSGRSCPFATRNLISIAYLSSKLTKPEANQVIQEELFTILCFGCLSAEETARSSSGRSRLVRPTNRTSAAESHSLPGECPKCQQLSPCGLRRASEGG
jgi:hypothetical protein